MNENKYINDVISEVMPKKLKEFRQRAGFGIEEVSKRIKKTPAMITNYEKGTSIPPASILYELCRIYGVEDINEIFSNEFLSSNFKCNEYLTKSEFELIQLWRSARKEGQLAAKTVLKAFKAKRKNRREDNTPCPNP